MFKSKCSKCSSFVEKQYDFCPFCGFGLRSKFDAQDYGLLGKNDKIENFMPPTNASIIEKMFSQTMKILEKQMRTMNQDMNNNPNNKNRQPELPNNMNVQFFINGKKVFSNEQTKPREIIREQPVVIRQNKISDEKLEMFSKLPKSEPVSSMRRINDKIIYELEIPGVKNINDILINRLESSIEIKAIAEDKTYSKIINVNLPIVRYQLNNGNLTLELQAGN